MNEIEMGLVRSENADLGMWITITTFSESVWISMDQNGSVWIRMDRYGSEWIRIDQNGSKWISMDQNGSKWINMDQVRQGAPKECLGSRNAFEVKIIS